MSRKIFVSVTASFDDQGNILPLSVIWEDGRVFPVDKVLDKRRAASLKAGGIGIRYTCSFRGHTAYLYYEEPRWFVEEK